MLTLTRELAGLWQIEQGSRPLGAALTQKGVRLGTIASDQSSMVPKISSGDIVVIHRKALGGKKG
jgi:hypothetical protein